MNPLQPGDLTSVALRNRFAVERQLESAKEGAARVYEEYRERLTRDADAAGRARADELEQLRHPAPVIPDEPPVIRVQAIKPFRIFAKNKYGEPEEHSAAAGAIVDVPKSVLRELGDRVEKAPPGAALRPIPLRIEDHQLLAALEGER